MQFKDKLFCSLSAHAGSETPGQGNASTFCLSNAASSKQNIIGPKAEFNNFPLCKQEIQASVRCRSVRTGIFSFPKNLFFIF